MPRQYRVSGGAPRLALRARRCSTDAASPFDETTGPGPHASSASGASTSTGSGSEGGRHRLARPGGGERVRSPPSALRVASIGAEKRPTRRQRPLLVVGPDLWSPSATNYPAGADTIDVNTASSTRVHRALFRPMARVPARTASSRPSATTTGTWATSTRTAPTSSSPATSATGTWCAGRCTSSSSTAIPTSPTASPRGPPRASGCRGASPRPRRRSVWSSSITRRTRPENTAPTRACAGPSPSGARTWCSPATTMATSAGGAVHPFVSRHGRRRPARHRRAHPRRACALRRRSRAMLIEVDRSVTAQAVIGVVDHRASPSTPGGPPGLAVLASAPVAVPRRRRTSARAGARRPSTTRWETGPRRSATRGWPVHRGRLRPQPRTPSTSHLLRSLSGRGAGASELRSSWCSTTAPRLPERRRCARSPPSGSTAGSAHLHRRRRGRSAQLLASIDPGLLVEGENVIAVELHQSTPASSDLRFDLALLAVP